MLMDARLTEIVDTHAYPQQPRFLLAALQDLQTAMGCVPEAEFAALAEYFRADGNTAAMLRPLFAVESAGRAGMAVCTGAVCRRFGLLAAMRENGQHDISACDCLGLCNQAPAARYRGESIPHASVELLQRRLAGD
jgi:NADH:ubiquinone oxidoreductase subunit E